MSDLPTEMIEYVPPDAPFSAEQRAWLNGFLAGLFATGRQSAPAVARAPAIPLTVLYGSQTGTAEALARSLVREAKQRGCEVTLAGMDEFEVASLAQLERVLVLCSTHGDGDPPDNAQDFWAGLRAADAPRLPGLRFAVFALGNTNYEKFCQCGRDIDERLASLGATRLHERVDCDVDVDEPFVRWRSDVLAALGGGEQRVPANPAAPAQAQQRPIAPAGRVASLVRVLENRNLNAVASDKETHHVVFGPGQPGPALAYEPGDAIAILPFNGADLVDEVMCAAGCDPQAVVVDQSEPMSLATALTERYAIGKLTAPTLRRFAQLRTIEPLLALFAPGNGAELQAYLHGRELIDLLLAYPGAIERPAQLVELLPRLAPRLYSIASSPRAHPGEVHVTVAAVRYRAHDRDRRGVCSTFLGDAPVGALVLAYVQENRRFRLPADGDVPVIMIGPGTGVAPFRAFIHERRQAGARGKNWLFFGDRRAATDFLYGEELAAFEREGVLTHLDLAFSRDQAEKVYVQDRLRERSGEVWAWLEAGAHLYVCGDAANMAKDVESELLAIVQREGRLSAAEAEAYVHALRKEHRYQRDVY